MAQRRASPQTSVSSPVVRKKYPLRRSPPYRRGPSSASVNFDSSRSTAAPDSRPVLVPLHTNLRRLPSRMLLAQKDSEINGTGRQHFTAQTGGKRKRVPSANENNAHHDGRDTRGSNRAKRFKTSVDSRMEYSSDEDQGSSMDIDAASQSSSRDSDVEEEEVDDEQEDESTDDYLINSAQPQQLLRLRKDELVRLYTLAGLSDDADALTKSDIVDNIVSARDDLASLPPSSPTGRGDGNSSDFSSDDGNPIDDNDPLAIPPHFSLRRRATTNDVSKKRPVAKSRSLSMGQILEHPTASSSRNGTTKSPGEPSGSSGPKRRSSGRSSPSSSARAAAFAFPSPPAHHLRSRKISAPSQSNSPPVDIDMSLAKMHKSSSKSKGKQVEFSDHVQIKIASPSKGHGAFDDEESDLTELDDSDAEPIGQPSPRRLRSKDREIKPADCVSSKGKGREVQVEDEAVDRRVTPMRKAKWKMKSLREDDDEQDDAEMMEDDGLEEEQEDVEEADEEVDELMSTVSATPPPTKRQLRPRVDTVPTDGDDELEDDEEGSVVEEEAEEEADEDDDDTIAVEPRKLRNGKIVGEEDVEMDVDTVEDDEESVAEEDEDEEAAEDNEDEAGDLEEASGDLDDEADSDIQAEDATDDDVDLAIATAKTLVRLRRDDLVRLCETRDLEPVGTKPQLAEALLEWRDRQSNDMSSPSSTGTIRPPSTAVKRRRGRKSSQESPPALLRSDHVHMDEPRTPPIKDSEPELELDLGTLGLEDREIPPDKLQKLEKIGSGGFKDVYVGKFRGRRIAISEFRGQLNAMDIKELKLLGGFDHPNIVRFLGVSIPENPRDTPVMIVSELCSNGDLFDYVRNVNPPSLHKVLTIMLDIARGLEYLHLRKPSVIHRDCKSSNILITSKGTAKIADFGLAKVKQSTRSMVRSLVGTVNWQAPELWHAHPKYNHKVDVFSCAMVYWEMLQWHLPNKKYPWEGMNEHAIYEIVGSKRQRPSITGLRKQWCPEIIDLVERMWAHEHQDRPTISEVVDALEELVRHR
ncbi:hypothetical protein C8J56DRAFT_1028895 [Mycena floridula]|nr:hypothetical protein C8J56DRAFT_1028895 [Mycena floridula]